MVVQHVNIQGLGRTKEDLLGYEISDVFHAKNLIDVCRADGVKQHGVVALLDAFHCLIISVLVIGDEEGPRGQTEAAPPGNFQRGGSPH